MSEVRLSDTTGDQWDEMAKTYQKLTVGTGVKPIGVMLECANKLLPFSEATGILDSGCGPGPGKKDEMVKEDPNSPWKRLEVKVLDAMDLKSIKDSSQSHVTAGWVYFMTPEPQKCLSESKRVLKDGGVLTCSSWKGSQWLDLMNLLLQVRPDKKMPELLPEWSNADALKAEMEKAGFREAECHEVETHLGFERLEVMADFMLTKMPHMMMLTKDMSDDEIKKVLDLIVEEGRKMCTTEPGQLKGTVLVAVGRK